jgi:peptide chain release factor 2
MASPDFWNDQARARRVSTQATRLREEVHLWETLGDDVTDALEIAKLDADDQNTSLRVELEEKLKKLEAQFAKQEFTTLLDGQYDDGDALLAIHAGTGGTEAQDWAEMLLRMYLRFCEKQGWDARIVDEHRGNEAGMKSVTLEVSGAYAFGLLKAEAGVHRLVRISPFDAEGMRHTSFALVEVLPQLDDLTELDIKDEDIAFEAFRAGGHGGQNVQKVNSAVRLKHIPTGIAVTSSSERSQIQNRESAMKILMAKLWERAEKERRKEEAQLRGEHADAAWGNQIRSTVLHPYQMVKDHRTKHESNQTQDVLDGDIMAFIEAYLRWDKEHESTRT